MTENESLESYLYNAVYRGDLEETERITDYLSGFGPWQPGIDLLCTALVYKHLEIARLFLSQGCEVIDDRRKHGGYTALHLAVLYGDSMMVDTILRKGASFNAFNLEGMTPLHLIVYRNHDEFRLPSSEAFDAESSAIIDLLLERGSNINSVVASEPKRGFTVLHLAAECGNENIIPLLLDKKADINSKAREELAPLHVAAINGHSRIVELFLKNGAVAFAKDVRGKSALRWALEKKHEAVAELLINHEIPTFQKHNFPTLTDDNHVLLSAIKLGNVSFVESLLNKGVPVDSYWRNRETALHVAVDRGIEEIVSLVLNRGANLRITTKDGKTPLYLAVEKGVAKIVEILLNSVSETDSMILLTGPSRCTPLHVAVMSDNREIVRLLLLKGTCVYREILSNTSYNNSGESLLHIAAKNGSSSICKLLLDHGADIDTIDAKGRNAIYFAAERGNLEMVHDLSDISLERRSEPKAWREGYAALYISAYYGNDKIVDLLLKKGVDLKANVFGYSTPLHVAVERGHEKIVALMLDHGFDVNEKRIGGQYQKRCGYTPLCCAAEVGKLKIVKLLLEKGADVNVKAENNQTPLFLAILFDHVDVVQYLVDHGADLSILNTHYTKNPCNINCTDLRVNCTSLALAVVARNNKIVDILLKSGAPADVENEEFPPLHFAAKCDMGAVVDKLLQYGAKVNSVCSLGYTPISHAVQGRQTKTMMHLIKSGAKLNTKTKEGDSLLHIAVEYPSSDKEIIKILLDCGLDVRARNEKEQTALHCFARSEEKNLYEFLLDYGADVNARDKMGNTPLHAATKNFDHASVKVLLKFDADINAVNLDGFTALELLLNTDDNQASRYYNLPGASVVKLFTQMIVIRETAGLYVRERNLQLVKESVIKSYYEECKRELCEMICKKVCLNVSFGDILIKNVSKLDTYFRNQSIVNALESTDFKKLFPIYALMLKTRVQKAKERKDLLESSVNHLKCILDFEFPCLVVPKIFSYLSSVDLKNMARVFQPPPPFLPKTHNISDCNNN